MTYLELQRYVETQMKHMLCCEVGVSQYVSLAVKRTGMCLVHSANKYHVDLAGGELRKKFLFPFIILYSIASFYIICHELRLK